MSLLASSVAYRCFGDWVEAIAELVFEESPSYHPMIRYIEAERI